MYLRRAVWQSSSYAVRARLFFKVRHMEIASWIIGFGGIIAALFAWIPVARFVGDMRRDMRTHDIAEGERRQVLSTMRHDIDEAHHRIGYLDTRVDDIQSIIVEMRTDMKHLVSTVDKIAQKVNV
jgi:hypothetical protein